jgi:hypothetical protein
MRRAAIVLAAPFDHLIGRNQHTGRHVGPQGFGGLQIDDELEPGQRLHRQIVWFLAAESATNLVESRHGSEIP